MQILLQRVSELCKKNKLSYNALERATGLTINSICKWGNSTPSGDKILKVAQYFSVSIDYLLGNTDNPESHRNVIRYDTQSFVMDLEDLKQNVIAQIEQKIAANVQKEKTCNNTEATK